MILLAADGQNSGVALAWEALRAGRPALDAIEAGVRAVEANPDEHSVGLSGYPNALGEVELDAAVMDGETRACGAVGGLCGFLHPVSVARAVMEKLPHVMLVGAGAARFADEIGAERAALLTEHTIQAWNDWLREQKLAPAGLNRTPLAEAVWAAMDPERPRGTTVYLAQDAAGCIAAATSTSGWAWKYPGRLGDTPVVGAGLYADSRYGAAACTGMGELAIRTSLARSAVLYMKMGMSVERAVREAMDDVRTLPNWTTSGVTLYAIDTAGGHYVLSASKPHHEAHYHIATNGDAAPTRLESNYM